MLHIIIQVSQTTLSALLDSFKMCVCVCACSGAVFVRNPLNRELVATFEIIVSVHDNASDVIDMSVSVPNGEIMVFIFI